jgi:hypothetical protein
MATAMITATVVGQQHLKDEFLSLFAGGFSADGAVSVIVNEDDPQRAVQVVLNPAPPVGIDVIDDVLILVCGATDTSSVRHLADRVWSVIDATPDWQPICLFVLHQSHRADVPQGAGIGALRELESKLDRDPRYYGSHHVSADPRDEVPSLRPLAALQLAIDVVKTPTHVIWDRRAQMFTLTGERALGRAFWLLDQDVDGFLSDAEILLWYNKMIENATEDDVALVKTNLRMIEATQPAFRLLDERGVTLAGFLAVCGSLARDNRTSVVWALLWDSGIHHDGLPYAPDAMERVPVCDGSRVVQLSLNGAKFFTSLYTKRRFAQLRDLWGFTPECPWGQINGMPRAEEELSCATFLKCWKVMARLDPHVVAEFAFYWGYKSDAALLFVSKPTRPQRTQDRDWPTTLEVLVLGGHGCGKSALLKRLQADEEAGGDDHHDGASTMSAAARGPLITALDLQRSGELTTLILREVPETEAFSEWIMHPENMATIDAVVVCFAGCDDNSLDFLYDAVPHLSKHRTLPVVFTLTKADLPFSEVPRKQPPNEVLNKAGFPWCPFATSMHDERLQALGITNDADTLAVTLLDAVFCVEATRLPVVSTARQIRRVVIVGVGVAIVGMVLKRLFGAGRTRGGAGVSNK